MYGLEKFWAFMKYYKHAEELHVHKKLKTKLEPFKTIEDFKVYYSVSQCIIIALKQMIRLIFILEKYVKTKIYWFINRRKKYKVVDLAIHPSLNPSIHSHFRRVKEGVGQELHRKGILGQLPRPAAPKLQHLLKVFSPTQEDTPAEAAVEARQMLVTLIKEASLQQEDNSIRYGKLIISLNIII